MDRRANALGLVGVARDPTHFENHIKETHNCNAESACHSADKAKLIKIVHLSEFTLRTAFLLAVEHKKSSDDTGSFVPKAYTDTPNPADGVHKHVY